MVLRTNLHTAAVLAIALAARHVAADHFGGLGTCPEFHAPESGEFRLEENLVGVGTNLEIQSPDGTPFGLLDERVLAIGAEYRVLNHDEELVATAKQKVISWGVSVRVDDCLGRHMATIEERVFESLWRVRTTYEILDPSGRQVARSDKTEFMGVDMEFVDPDDNVLGRIERSLMGGMIYDVWNGSITDGSPDAMIVLAVAAALKSRADNKRSEN